MFGISKIFIIIAIVTAISATIGGYWLTQRSLISSLQKDIRIKEQTISDRESHIASLKLDRAALMSSNKSLTDQLQKNNDEIKNYIRRTTELEMLDMKSRNKLKRYNSMISDIKRNQRISDIRNSKHSSLLIRKINEYWNCWINHIDEPNGECINGKFKKQIKKNVSSVSVK